MPKIPQCDHCLYHTNDHHLVCALHPNCLDTDTCLDFTPNPELEGKQFVDFVGLLQQERENFDSSEPFSNPFDLEPDRELWEPEGATYYAGELILQPQQCWTKEEQLELLDTHPIFTGYCPECGYKFSKDTLPQVHWDCPNCIWKDDSL